MDSHHAPAATNRLYYRDAYCTAFSATVLERADAGRRVYLNETAFYPTSGGQPHDLGRLGGIDVVDVVDEDHRIAHLLAQPLPAGDAVAGEIDWARRFDHMQQHTGQHLLSAVFEDLFGLRTVSVHFGAGHSTLDLDAPSVSADQLVAVETRANALVAEARPVQVTFEDAAAATGLRKPSERQGTLRIVGIDGVDRSACGGTHVRSTSEIGVVLLGAVEKIRKSTRVEFVCGTRGVRRARHDHEALSHIAASLSASAGDVPDLVAALSQRLEEGERSRKKLERELAGFRARERYDAAPPGERGLRAVVIRDASSMDELRALAQAMFALPRVVVIGALADPPSVLVATSEDSGVEAGRVLRDQLTAVGGRGGGSPRLAQGSVPDATLLDSLVSEIVRSAQAHSS